jgi:hypothetical protein
LAFVAPASWVPVQRLFEAGNHLANGFTSGNQVGGFAIGQALAPVCAIKAGPHFSIRRRGDAQKMQELRIVMSQKTFTACHALRSSKRYTVMLSSKHVVSQLSGFCTKMKKA